MSDTNTAHTTLTTRVAALMVKMFHLQFRMKKIYEDQSALNDRKRQFKTNRDRIRGMNNAAYSLIDMMITMEHAQQLMQDILSTKELGQHIGIDVRSLLKTVRTIAERWKPVRNKLGGHIDFDVVERMCEAHNFKGVFLSDDLESDVGVLNMLLIESAVNAARTKSDIFGRDLVMKEDLTGEARVLVDQLNRDWNEVFGYFEPLMKLIYSAGKAEKTAATRPEDRVGIVRGD